MEACHLLETIVPGDLSRLTHSGNQHRLVSKVCLLCQPSEGRVRQNHLRFAVRLQNICKTATPAIPFY